LKPEWWGSPLAQEEKYQEERKPVTSNDDDNDDNDDNNSDKHSDRRIPYLEHGIRKHKRKTETG
jgi:hypothetical protein